MIVNNETFKISAALKDIIGKELITDEFVAIFELVKNSFDADASKVEVIFENNYEINNARIIIKDNGKGMNYNDLKNKWLFVAYSAKRHGKENDDYRNKIKSRRVFAGAKGVGRFSCDRLGKHLNLITLKDEANAVIQKLVINWEDFENVDDKEFININVTHSTINENIYQLEKGTVLEISGLRDLWNRERILKLKKSLAKLINPNQENDSQNFSIEIIAKDEESLDNEPNKNGKPKKDSEIVNGIIINSIFETLKIKTSNILAKISPDGSYIETILQDRGDKIYCLTEKNPYMDLKNISIYLFQLNKIAKASFTRQMGMESVKYGSVFVYKNGFRVYPFGEEGEDILQIDRRKQQGYNRFLGTRDLIGRIEINGEQPELVETTSRDGGLKKTETYHNLISFFHDFVLKRLENYVVNIIQWGDERVNKDTKEVRPALWAKDVKIQILELITGFISSQNVIDIQYDKNFLKIIAEKQDKSVDKIIKNISKIAEKYSNTELVKEVQKIEKVILRTKTDATIDREKATNEENLRKVIEQKLEYIITQNNFLQKDIGDDTKNLESILHHIGLNTPLMKADIENLVKAINNNEPKQYLFDIINRISMLNEKINSFSKYFKKVNFKHDIKNLDVDIVSFINEYIENVYKLREDLKTNRELLNVKIDMQQNIDLKLKINPVDVIIVIDNLISNSLKHKATEVIIRWLKLDSCVRLSYQDNGDGIPDDILEHIFDFGFTTSRRGSGIGLYHVKEIIENMHGSINVNNKISNGVEFLMDFRK